MVFSQDSDPVPSYYDFIMGVYHFMIKTVTEDYLSGRKPTREENKWRYLNFEYFDLMLVALLALLFTALRHFSTKWIFKPLAARLSLTLTSYMKLPESAWKLTYYLCAWSFTFYVVILSGKYRVFQQPSLVWDGWSLNEAVPTDIYLMYLIQSSFYTHSLYATLFLDTWRKDSPVMITHHILTVALIFVSYALRYHVIGALVLFLHDVCDIQLEFTKLNVYLKNQRGRVVKSHVFLTNVGFLCFTITWFVTRLYWYPLKVMYSATSVVLKKNLILPGAILLNMLLWILLAMNIYWFLFIVGFVLRVLTGKATEVDDTREYDVEEKFSQQLSAKLRSVSESVDDDELSAEDVFGYYDNYENETFDVRKAIRKTWLKKDD